MMRRRAIMLQKAAGFELIYDAADGVLPPAAEWEVIGVPWDPQNLRRTIENNTFKVELQHIYEHMPMYVRDHATAVKSYGAIQFVGTPEMSLAILLTDGTLSAMGGLHSNGKFSCADRDSKGVASGAVTSKQMRDVTYGDDNLFECYKYPSYAEYYLNGNLIYTQEELHTYIATYLSGSWGDRNNNGYVRKVENAFCVGYGTGTVYIKKMIYREF